MHAVSIVINVYSMTTLVSCTPVWHYPSRGPPLTRGATSLTAPQQGYHEYDCML